MPFELGPGHKCSTFRTKFTKVVLPSIRPRLTETLPNGLRTCAESEIVHGWFETVYKIGVSNGWSLIVFRSVRPLRQFCTTAYDISKIMTVLL